MSAKAMLSHKTDNWATPPKFYEELNARFSFDPFDPCPLNCKGDGRVVDWIGDTIFVNPPYSKLKTTNKGGIGWVELCHNKCQDGKTIVMLIPARTCTSWFHDIILKHGYAVEFVRGRLKFGDGTTSAPFPSMLVIMKPKKKNLV
jgi:site-specific DNA-methyltransferase (adenine-specific)